MDHRTSPAHRLIEKMESYAPLSDAEKWALEALPVVTRFQPRHTEIVHDGEHVHNCTLILQGFVCRYKVLSRGQRQIYSFHIPGEIPDLQSLHLPITDYSLRAMADTHVALFPLSAMEALIQRHPAVGAALWRTTLLDGVIGRQWLVGAARRTAYQRVGHLICEMFVRMRGAGLVDKWRFVMPVIQAEIGDCVGLSAVHVNRVLQDLRQARLIEYAGKHLEIRDWAGLRRAADFDEAYLYSAPVANTAPYPHVVSEILMDTAI